VSLQELIDGGYISRESVQAFEGMEAKIWFTANPSVPSSVLMSAQLADGTVIAALADGSVHQFSARRFREHINKTGQPSDPPNGGPAPAVDNSDGSGGGRHR
jgi:hypothetical protein